MFRGTELMDRLIQHVKNEQKETRRMPNLSANVRADMATDSMEMGKGKYDEQETMDGGGQAGTIKEKMNG